MMTVICGMVILFWLGCNVCVASTMSAEEMRAEFVTEQSGLSRVGANTFYSLAWLIKKI